MKFKALGWFYDVKIRNKNETTKLPRTINDDQNMGSEEK